MSTNTTFDPIGMAVLSYRGSKKSAAELATDLDIDLADILAALDEAGVARSLEENRLSPEERAARLAALDRRVASGAPTVDEALVRREVLSSQRIETVDARPWLSTTR